MKALLSALKPLVGPIGKILMGEARERIQEFGTFGKPKTVKERVAKGILTSKSAGGAAGSIVIGLGLLVQGWPWWEHAQTAGVGAGVLVFGALALYGRYKADKPLFHEE